MADNDNNGEHQTTSRGADWEVVQMTASTYAAAPREVGLADETRHEPQRALFMSDHFVFPPSEHENLPIEPEVTEVQGELESLSIDWDDDSAPHNNEKEKLWTASRADPYQLHLSEEEDTEGYMVYTQNNETQILNLDEDDEGETPESPRKYAEHGEEKKLDVSRVPCKAWWQKHASSAYSHGKDGNTLLSIVLAATVVGLVILGHRWQREKWQFDKYRWRFGINDESIRRMFSRYK